MAYYGLAATGIICLSLLNQSFPSNNDEITLAKVLQDLNVLVAEVEAGALVHLEDPNYALLARATLTIKSILNRLLPGDISKNATIQWEAHVTSQDQAIHTDEEWVPWDNRSLQDFEVDFWLNLAEHPFLAEPENETQDVPRL